ncbi:PrpR N-terminal domain-containing protein [Neobacillus drentensis]|uniref:sigma-54-dependent Fis family transcriptional regulator n=1 Tax=Neobacillus drentensis TaxID=220684 RepID=UPI001F3F61B3|nr:sigma-54-dependent transcriptional regulator [Neobacillus drentensis]ULT57642.1 PrpR N-terminal domain-containing protein [Neobacillus drentensis]
MKIKALFVAPYAAMENLIEECRYEETEIDLHIEIGNLQEGVALAKKAEAQGFDVIISRGGTAKLIGETVGIPVIDVHISGYDMLRVFTLANDLPRKKAIVGFPTITLGAKAIIDLLDIPIDIFTINDESETEPLLSRLKHEGYQLIIGDVVTYETASRLGLLGILLQSGREAIFDSFKEAKMVARWMLNNKLEIERLKALLHITAKDFMLLSHNGDIVYEQWATFQSRPINEIPLIMDTNQDEASGKEISYIKDNNGETLKLIKTKIMTTEFSYLFCQFSHLKINPESEEIMKVNVLAPPPIIHHSKAMNLCLNMIDRCLSHTRFILNGKRGTEKELIAQYIHYHKTHGNGLFASIKALDLLDINLEKVDKDIKTIYIHSIDLLDEALRDELWRKIGSIKVRGITIIIGMIELQHSWEIYSDDIIRIYIPSLAERKEDLKELVTSFILHFNQTLGTSAIKMREDGLALLAEYDWPGNVGELKAILKDAVLMEKGYVIEKGLVESLLKQKGSADVGISTDFLMGTLEDIEKRIIEKVLEEEEFNQTKAAKRLNINRSTLWRKLKS